MSKCNSLYQDRQEAFMRQKYQEYCADLDEGETPMTIDEFAADLSCEEDHRLKMGEP